MASLSPYAAARRPAGELAEWIVGRAGPLPPSVRAGLLDDVELAVKVRDRSTDGAAGPAGGDVTEHDYALCPLCAEPPRSATWNEAALHYQWPPFVLVARDEEARVDAGDPLFTAPDRLSRTSSLVGRAARTHRALRNAIGGAEFFEGTTTEALTARRILMALHDVLEADPPPPDVVAGVDAVKLPPGSVFVERGRQWPILAVLEDGEVYMAGSGVIAHPASGAGFEVYHRAPTTPAAAAPPAEGEVVFDADRLDLATSGTAVRMLGGARWLAERSRFGWLLPGDDGDGPPSSVLVAYGGALVLDVPASGDGDG